MNFCPKGSGHAQRAGREGCASLCCLPTPRQFYPHKHMPFSKTLQQYAVPITQLLPETKHIQCHVGNDRPIAQKARSWALQRRNPMGFCSHRTMGVVWKFTKLVARLGCQRNQIRQETREGFIHTGGIKLFCVECVSVPLYTPRGTTLSGFPGTLCVPGQICLGHTVCSLVEGRAVGFANVWNPSSSSSSVEDYNPDLSCKGSCPHSMC